MGKSRLESSPASPRNTDHQTKKPPESGELHAAREKAKAASKAARRKEQKELEQQSQDYLRIPSLTPEKISTARKAIKWALNEMKTDDYKKLFKKLGITLESADYYLAIAVKESGLNPLGKSEKKPDGSGDAKGLFQIKTGAGYGLDDIKNIFGISIEPSQVFYLPEKAKNKKEKAREKKYLETATANNALAGILYWHICKDIFRQRQKLQIPKDDQDRAACFTYKLGVGDFANLWKSIGAKDFNEFATKLSTQLAQKFPENFVIPKGGRDVLPDPTYKLNFVSYLYTAKPLVGGTIKIGSRNYDAANLVQTLRYSEIIQSLARKQPPAYEIAQERYKLWSIADKLLTRCAYGYGMEYCRKNSTPNNKKIWLLVDIIKEYNIKLKNPDFQSFADEDEHEEAELEDGAKVFLPPKEYLEKALKKSHEDVKTESLPTKPGTVPMYTGPDAAKMEKIGNKLIAPPKVPPTIIIPRFKQKSGEYLDPYVDAGHGRMPKSQTKAIVIHSTEGGADGLREGQNIHFVLRKDGVIELIRDMDIAVSHAGNMTNPKHSKHAIWEGEKEPSYHTVGIEVINTSLPALIRDGRVNVPLDKKAEKQVVLAKILHFYTDGPSKGKPILDKQGRQKFRMALLTPIPPSQKAIDSGFKQARQGRGFTEAQYKSLKDLIAYIGAKKGLKYKDVVTHSMIACSDSGRGRKSDPPVLYWEYLGVPNNHYRVDPDVAPGTIKGNTTEAENIRTGKKMTMVRYNGKLYYEVLPSKIGVQDAYSYFPEARFGGTESMIAGVKAAEKIWQSKKNKNKKAK